MGYVKAVIGALLAALLLGAGTGAGEVFTGALGRLRPEDKQVLYAAGVSVAMNNVALFVVLFVPVAAVLVFAVRRWRRRSAPGGAG